MIKAGNVYHVGAQASVQFGGGRDLLFRVIRIQDLSTYEGWIWLDGYVLNRDGTAVERRSIFVRVNGLRPVGKAPDPRPRNQRHPTGPRPAAPARD